MSEEKKLILKMLKEDKITEEEALKLLDAIGDKKEETFTSQSFTDKGFDTTNFEKKVENFANKIVSGVDNALKTAGEKLKNVEVGYDFDLNLGDGKSFSFSRLKASTTKEIRIDLDGQEAYNLKVNNTNGYIEVLPWDEDYVRVFADIKYDDRYVDESFEFIKSGIQDGTINIDALNTEYKKQPFVANMKIYLPQSANYDNVTVESLNGHVSSEDIKANKFDVNTVNGSINLDSMDITELEAESVNGAISLESIDVETSRIEAVNGRINVENVKSPNLNLSTVNGQISIEDCDAKEITAETVNGAINFNGEASEVKLLNLETVNGKIGIDFYNLNRPTMLNCSSSTRVIQSINLPEKFIKVDRTKRNLQAFTGDYVEGRDSNLDINVTTLNGKISIEA